MKTGLRWLGAAFVIGMAACGGGSRPPIPPPPKRVLASEPYLEVQISRLPTTLVVHPTEVISMMFETRWKANAPPSGTNWVRFEVSLYFHLARFSTVGLNIENSSGFAFSWEEEQYPRPYGWRGLFKSDAIPNDWLINSSVITRLSGTGAINYYSEVMGVYVDSDGVERNAYVLSNSLTSTIEVVKPPKVGFGPGNVSLTVPNISGNTFWAGMEKLPGDIQITVPAGSVINDASLLVTVATSGTIAMGNAEDPGNFPLFWSVDDSGTFRGASEKQDGVTGGGVSHALMDVFDHAHDAPLGVVATLTYTINDEPASITVDGGQAQLWSSSTE